MFRVIPAYANMLMKGKGLKEVPGVRGWGAGCWLAGPRCQVPVSGVVAGSPRYSLASKSEWQILESGLRIPNC